MIVNGISNCCSFIVFPTNTISPKILIFDALFFQGEWTDECPATEERDGVLITFQTGKGADHLVPVFFPPCTHKALNYLVSKEARDNAGVSPANNYIFANTQGSNKYIGGCSVMLTMI